MLDGETALCALEDIEDNNALGMVARVDGKQRNIFIARKGDKVYAYLNWCPHAQVLLDQNPGTFMDGDSGNLRCGMHSAIFRVEDGFCIEGPCEGKSLDALTTDIRDGRVHLVK
ncbi:MAG: Rieske 2Fe-2S domain-containing protein [Rhodospirillales bacterium]|nr:Rieske 2Fe-2S domain-containing protein [Rhodospirillales bacterium]